MKNNHTIFYCFRLLLFLLTPTLGIAQTGKDSLLIVQYLARAQQQLDSSRYDLAIESAREAETIADSFAPNRPTRNADVYCMLGFCLLKTDPGAAMPYLENLEKQFSALPNLEQAHVRFISGTLSLLTGDLDAALHDYAEAQLLYGRQPGTPHVNLARIYNNTGRIMAIRSRFDEALDDYDKALQLWTQIHGQQHPNLANAYGNSGLVYMEQGRYVEAAEVYRKALELRTRALPPNHLEIAAIQINLGLLYLIQADLNRAEEYFEKALSVVQNATNVNKTNYLSVIYNNLGSVLSKKNEPAQARRYFERTLELELTIYREDDPEIATTNFNIATTFQDEKQYQKALEYEQKALLIAKADHPQLSQFYNGVGLACEGLKDFKKAKEYYLKANENLQQMFGEIHPAIANVYLNLGNLAQRQGDTEEALRMNARAKESLGYKAGKNIQEMSWLFELSAILAQESRLRWLSAAKSREPAALDQVLQACDLHFEMLEQMTRMFYEPATLRSFMAEAFASSEIAISTNLMLRQITTDPMYESNAFTLAERSKAFQLYKAMQETNALHVAGIPDSLLNKELRLRVEIASFDKAIGEMQANNTPQTDSTLVDWFAKRFDLKRSYEALKSRFELDFKKYYEAKYAFNTLSVTDIQQTLLQPDQTLLEYAVGDSSAFLFLIQKDRFKVFPLAKDSLEAWVTDMTKNGIYGFYNLPEAQRSEAAEEKALKNYTYAARKLYDRLLLPVQDLLTKSLVIVPDGVISYVPFEALLTDTPPRSGMFAKYPYVVYDHQISYCYSATLLRQMRDKKHRKPNNGEVLALAPFFHEDVQKMENSLDTNALFAMRADLKPLKFSGLEVGSVVKLFKGQALYGQAASLDTFRQLCSRYRILHLSTHGQADDRGGDDAFLAFGAPQGYSQLFARDLYNLDLNADMVVLSACETALGKLQRGEGVISLARAFAYAGAKSLITTLWKVDDEKTRDLMVAFYRRLREGRPTEEALQLAKLDFLKNNRSNGGAGMHPFFWSGFIGVGDMRALH